MAQFLEWKAKQDILEAELVEAAEAGDPEGGENENMRIMHGRFSPLG